MVLRKIHLLVIILLGVMACTSDNDLNTDNSELVTVDEVFVRIGIGQSTSRSNQPLSDNNFEFENNISNNKIRMIAFERNHGEVILNQKLQLTPTNASPGSDASYKSEVFSMEAGRYDFIFIANENSMQASNPDLEKQLDNLIYKQDIEDLRLSFNAFLLQDTNPFGKGILMYATYDDITIPKPINEGIGSSESNPWPFRNRKEASVHLSRGVAKIVIALTNPLKNSSGETITPNKKIKQIEITNTPTSIFLPSQGSEVVGGFSELILDSNDLTHLDYTKEEVGQLVIYAPEHLIIQGGSQKTEVRFTMSAADDSSSGEVKTIGLNTNAASGSDVEIDNIAKFKQIDGISTGYLDKEYDKYSVFRSVQYNIAGRLSSDFELGLEVVDWHTVDYNQSWKPENPNQKIKAIHILDNKFIWSPIDRTLTTKDSKVTLKFHINQAELEDQTTLEGGKLQWRFGLTNGADFEVTDGSHSGIGGGEYTITVQPRKEQSSLRRNTKVEFYMNGTLIKPSMIYSGGVQLFPENSSDMFDIFQSAK